MTSNSMPEGMILNFLRLSSSRQSIGSVPGVESQS